MHAALPGPMPLFSRNLLKHGLQHMLTATSATRVVGKLWTSPARYVKLMVIQRVESEGRYASYFNCLRFAADHGRGGSCCPAVPGNGLYRDSDRLRHRLPRSLPRRVRCALPDTLHPGTPVRMHTGAALSPAACNALLRRSFHQRPHHHSAARRKLGAASGGLLPAQRV